MKKILVLITVALLSLPAYCTENVSLKETSECQKYINQIGFRILNANKIEQRTNFYYQPSSKQINAFSNLSDRKITFGKGLMPYIESDDEMAAILSHEISHSVDSYDGIMKGFFNPFIYVFTSKKFENKADKRAADYMVRAGYNPVAIIVVYNKLMTQRRYEWSSSHPLSSKRMMRVYEYIYRKYPEYLVNNEYKDNIYYQNFLLTSQKNREKLKQSLSDSKNKRIRYE